jgi:hypothetical protein
MFAKRITKDVEVNEGDKVVSVTIQKLSGRALRHAQEQQTISELTSMRAASRDMWAGLRSAEAEELAQRVADKKKKETADPKARAKARYAAHDRTHVLNAGIVRWNASVPLTPESIDELDEETCEKLHEAILDLSLPPLDPVEAEAVIAKD